MPGTDQARVWQGGDPSSSPGSGTAGRGLQACSHPASAASLPLCWSGCVWFWNGRVGRWKAMDWESEDIRGAHLGHCLHDLRAKRFTLLICKTGEETGLEPPG